MARYRILLQKYFFASRNEEILRHFSFYWIAIATEFFYEFQHAIVSCLCR
jgi:hypothetical protein